MTRNTLAAGDYEAIVKSTRSGVEKSIYEPSEVELAESFGGGSEYFPFWRLLVWPGSLLCLFGQEDE